MEVRSRPPCTLTPQDGRLRPDRRTPLQTPVPPVASGDSEQADPRLQSFADAIPQGVLVVDGDGRIAVANRAAEALFGYDTGDLIGESVDLLVPESLRGAHADHRVNFDHTQHARMMGNARDFRARRRDGTEFLAQIGISPWKSDRGMQVVACIMDVSARRSAEDEALAQQKAAGEAGVLSQAIISDTTLGIMMFDGESGA